MQMIKDDLIYAFLQMDAFWLLQQTTFKSIVAKGEIAQNEQFLLLSQCFQLFSVIILSLLKKFHIFAYLFLAPLAESQSSLCHGELSVVRASVRALTFSFKQLLLPNHLANLVETS